MELQISTRQIKNLIEYGQIKAHQVTKGAPWSIMKTELNKNSVKKTAERIRNQVTNTKVVPQTPNQKSLFE